MSRPGDVAAKVLPLLQEERCVSELRRMTGVARGSLEYSLMAAVRDGLARVTRTVPAVRYGRRGYYALTDKGRAKLEETCSPT